MKNTGKYSLKGKAVLLILFVFMGMVSCNDRWAEMNTDPNRVSVMPDEYLFTTAVKQTFKTQIDRFEVDFGGQYAHIWVSNNWVREADKYLDYLAQGDIAERVFNGMYNEPIRNINEVLVLTGEGGAFENKMRNAQARIIAVVNFSRLTDLFGDIPYFEGGMGKYDILKPKYDKQVDIYNDMLNKLKECITVLKSGNASDAYPAGEDPLYDGTLDNWIRFANSMRLRVAMRARNVDPAKYNTIITECLSQPLIETNLQNATLTCWDSENGDLYNPWNNYYTDVSNGTFILNFSEKFINTLTETNDPRLPFFATKNKQGKYVGMPNGLNDEYYAAWNRSNTAMPTADFFAKDQPMFLMTAAEIWLLRAEAALDGMGSGNSNEMYQTGIKLAMSQWNIGNSEIQNYIANEKEATLYGDKNNTISQIATQLWISFVPNAFEAWSTIRRTGYPELPVRDGEILSKGVTNGVLPSRIKYPYTVEKGVNGDNLQNAITSMGGDKIDIKLWWNKK
jgi:hypothetical protein